MLLHCQLIYALSNRVMIKTYVSKFSPVFKVEWNVDNLLKRQMGL